MRQSPQIAPRWAAHAAALTLPRERRAPCAATQGPACHVTVDVSMHASFPLSTGALLSG